MNMTFPSTYPNESPSVTILSPFPHPHVYGNKICLDLLSDYRDYFDGTEYTGWSSAYSVSTILLQLQCSFWHFLKLFI